MSWSSELGNRKTTNITHKGEIVDNDSEDDKDETRGLKSQKPKPDSWRTNTLCTYYKFSTHSMAHHTRHGVTRDEKESPSPHRNTDCEQEGRSQSIRTQTWYTPQPPLQIIMQATHCPVNQTRTGIFENEDPRYTVDRPRFKFRVSWELTKPRLPQTDPPTRVTPHSLNAAASSQSAPR